MLSPATLTALGRSRADLFGRVAGVIAPSGLESPGERRVYLRPTRAAFDPHRMVAVSGFGGNAPQDAFYGLPTLNAVRTSEVLTMLAATVVVPWLSAHAM